MKNNLKSTLSQHVKDQDECVGHDLNENISNYSDSLIKFFELLIEADPEIKQKNNIDKDSVM
jgi:hypothetical protein